MEAFDKLKQALTTAPVLSFYDPLLPTRMQTDTSDGVVAGVLSQKITIVNSTQSLSSAKIMKIHKLNYEIHDKELLALTKGLRE